MKKKLDFVTNSSSCAFIFIGWVLETGDKINEIVKENMEIFGSNEYDPELRPYENLNEIYNGKVDITLGDSENGLPENKLCIGMNVRIHDDDYESHEYSIQDVLDIDPKLADTFHTDDIRIISGMEVC
jgi:hypothetical protein